MADNTAINTGSGPESISDEDLGGGVHLPRSKIVVGARGTDAGDAGLATPLMVGSTPLEFQASLSGLIDGRVAKVRNILGVRSLGWLNTSSVQDCCEYLDTSQAAMNVPTVGQTLYIVSTSASDTNVAGTGARTVRLVWLDVNGVEQVTTANLAGTSTVSLGTGFAAIQWMEVASAGSALVPAGNIAITSTNGVATVATTFEFIAAGNERSLSGRYVVPASYTAFLQSWSGNAIGATMDARIRATAFTDDRTLSTVFHAVDRMYLPASALQEESLHQISCPAGSTIKVSAVPGQAQAGNRLDADFQILLVHN